MPTLAPLDVLLIALATWRLAYLVTKEDAPFRLMARIRERTTLGGVLECTYCASVWMAALTLALWFTPLAPVVVVLALSGAALMLASYTGVGHQN